MVVLAASICTRGGKAILSRQFRDLHKDRVAALLANFPKLTQSGTQHTTVEDGNVRYVYQPVEELYVVLITNRQSNILQDISTLRLLTQIVSSTVRTVDEREILQSAFELLSAFDEVVTLGYRENLTLPQIKTFLEMESHEEKIQEIIERNKELEAAEERKKKAKQLEMQRREVSRRGGARPGQQTSGGFGNNSMGSGGFPTHQPSSPAPSSVYNSSGYDVDVPTKPKVAPPRGKGLQLGSKKSSGLGSLAAEHAPLMGEDPMQYRAPAAAAAPVAVASSPRPTAANVSDNQGIAITITEGISATLGRDGSVLQSDVKGTLGLRIATPELSKIKLLVAADATESGAQFKTHPKVDRARFTQQKVVAIRDTGASFPSNNQELPVVKWTIGGRKDDTKLVPLTFNCWFSRSDPGFFDVTVEYDFNPEFPEALENVVLHIPLVSSNAHVADPSLITDQFDDHLEWIIPLIQPGSEQTSGSFEFTAEADSEDDFFPMQISFRSAPALTSLSAMDISDVVASTDESISLPFEKTISLVSDSYTIQ